MIPIRTQLFLQLFFHHLGRKLLFSFLATYLSYALFPTQPLVPSGIALLAGILLHRPICKSGQELFSYLYVLLKIPESDFTDPIKVGFWLELLEVEPGYLKEFQEHLMVEMQNEITKE